jgi:UTP-glucose-1-phosphate uridylyltransferase
MVNQIRVIKLVNGDDIVCSLAEEQISEKSPLLRLNKPLQIKYVSQVTPLGLKDYIALIKWAAYTGDTIITIPKDKIMTITNATAEMTKSYEKIAKNYLSLDVPKKDDVYEQEQLSDDENESFNTLWDDFRDSKKTYH